MPQSISQSKLTELLPVLKEICNQYGLKINRADDFKLAKMILANLYFPQIDFI